MNGNLTLLGSEHFTLNADDISHIEFLEICVGFFAETVTCHITLNVARKILQKEALPMTRFAIRRPAMDTCFPSISSK